MKKVISIIALVVAMVMAMSVSAFAADPAFMVAENADYDADVTTVTPAADSIAVETATTAGNYYGILLVKGTGLPDEDTPIHYIDQKTAAAGVTAFDVLPLMEGIEAGDVFTLYISSNVAGAELIAIPMVYDAEEEVIVPTYTLGDVDQDGEVAALKDAAEIVNYQNFEASVFDNYSDEVAAAVADVDKDGEYAALKDAAEIVNYQNFEPSVFDNY